MFVVVDKVGSASTSNSACCGCFQRRNRETVLEMYSLSFRCNCGEKPHGCAGVSPTNEKLKTNCGQPKTFKNNRNKAESHFIDDPITVVTGKNNHQSQLTHLSRNKRHSYSLMGLSGKEELPCDLQPKKTHIVIPIPIHSSSFNRNDRNGFKRVHYKYLNANDKVNVTRNVFGYCTLPKIRKSVGRHYLINSFAVPKRVTADGTSIYYWCDAKKAENCGKFVFLYRAAKTSIF